MKQVHIHTGRKQRGRYRGDRNPPHRSIISDDAHKPIGHSHLLVLLESVERTSPSRQRIKHHVTIRELDALKKDTT
jgi:hypothetical protein